jgi:hypothetical protein
MRRDCGRRFPQAIVLRPSIAMLCAVIFVGIGFALAQGFPNRFSPAAVRVSAYLAPNPENLFRAGTCFVSKSDERFDWDACLGRDTGAPRVILFGDSHAADLWPGLRDNSERLSLRQVTATYCPMLLPSYATGSPFCSDVADRFFKQYLRTAHPRDTIMISERWLPNRMADLRVTIRAFRKTGARVVVVGPAPEYEMALPRLEFASLVRNDPAIVSRAQIAGIAGLDQAVGSVAAAEHARYVSLVRALCSGNSCRSYAAPDVPLMMDTDHLTAEGARLLSPFL